MAKRRRESKGSIKYATAKNVTDAVASWLGEIEREVKFSAVAGKKPTSSVRIVGKSGRKRAVVSAVGKGAAYEAADVEFYVPIGGFARKEGGWLAWPIRGWGVVTEKNPEGILFRTRTYVKYGGQMYRRRGYLMDAFRKVFIQHGVENITNLGTDVCFEIAKVVVKNLVPKLVSFDKYRGKGVHVMIRARVGGKFISHSINQTFTL